MKKNNITTLETSLVNTKAGVGNCNHHHSAATTATTTTTTTTTTSCRPPPVTVHVSIRLDEFECMVPEEFASLFRDNCQNEWARYVKLIELKRYLLRQNPEFEQLLMISMNVVERKKKNYLTTTEEQIIIQATNSNNNNNTVHKSQIREEKKKKDEIVDASIQKEKGNPSKTATHPPLNAKTTTRKTTTKNATKDITPVAVRKDKKQPADETEKARSLKIAKKNAKDSKNPIISDKGIQKEEDLPPKGASTPRNQKLKSSPNTKQATDTPTANKTQEKKSAKETTETNIRKIPQITDKKGYDNSSNEESTDKNHRQDGDLSKATTSPLLDQKLNTTKSPDTPAPTTQNEEEEEEQQQQVEGRVQGSLESSRIMKNEKDNSKDENLNSEQTVRKDGDLPESASLPLNPKLNSSQTTTKTTDTPATFQKAQQAEEITKASSIKKPQFTEDKNDNNNSEDEISDKSIRKDKDTPSPPLNQKKISSQTITQITDTPTTTQEEQHALPVDDKASAQGNSSEKVSATETQTDTSQQQQQQQQDDKNNTTMERIRLLLAEPGDLADVTVSPMDDDDPNSAVIVTMVTPQSEAHRATIKVGDVLCEAIFLNENVKKEITMETFRELANDKEKDKLIILEIKRPKQEKKKPKAIMNTPKRIRILIDEPRVLSDIEVDTVHDDPNCVVVSSITPGSKAEKAKIMVGDIIWKAILLDDNVEKEMSLRTFVELSNMEVSNDEEEEKLTILEIRRPRQVRKKKPKQQEDSNSNPSASTQETTTASRKRKRQPAATTTKTTTTTTTTTTVAKKQKQTEPQLSKHTSNRKTKTTKEKQTEAKQTKKSKTATREKATRKEKTKSATKSSKRIAARKAKATIKKTKKQNQRSKRTATTKETQKGKGKKLSQKQQPNSKGAATRKTTMVAAAAAPLQGNQPPAAVKQKKNPKINSATTVEGQQQQQQQQQHVPAEEHFETPRLLPKGKGTASIKQLWGCRYLELKEYYAKHGHYQLPHDHPYSSFWSRQRHRGRLFRQGKCPQFKAKYELLNQLEGFDWGVDHGKHRASDGKEYDWDFWFERLKEYKEKHGDLEVPTTNKEYSALAIWLRNARGLARAVRNGRRSVLLNPERYQKLVDLGVTLNTHDVRWEKQYNKLKQYKEKHGDCLVPRQWPEDPKFPQWLALMRKSGKDYISGKKNPANPTMTEERFKLLEELGFPWELT